LEPVSDAPNASTMATLGARSLSSALMVGERIAPPDYDCEHRRWNRPVRERVDERSRHRVAYERDHAHVLAFHEIPYLVGVEATAGVQHHRVAAEERNGHRPLRVAVHQRRERHAHAG
jgi:hypothetical protein